MTASISEITKKGRGRPKTTGKGQPVLVRLQTDDLFSLDSYASSRGDSPSRPQAIRAILADWLSTHGFGPSDTVKPIGPATDAVEAMSKLRNPAVFEER